MKKGGLVVNLGVGIRKFLFKFKGDKGIRYMFLFWRNILGRRNSWYKGFEVSMFWFLIVVEGVIGKGWVKWVVWVNFK